MSCHAWYDMISCMMTKLSCHVVPPWRNGTERIRANQSPLLYLFNSCTAQHITYLENLSFWITATYYSFQTVYVYTATHIDLTKVFWIDWKTIENDKTKIIFTEFCFYRRVLTIWMAKKTLNYDYFTLRTENWRKKLGTILWNS